jgi:hypothetical protein
VRLADDAGILVRSLLNLLIIARWIGRDSDRERRARWYQEWFWIAAKPIVTREPARAEYAAYPAKIREAEEFFRAEGPRRGEVPKKWHGGVTIEQMAKDVGMTEAYEEAYRGLSSLEHSDIMAFLPLIRGQSEDLRVALWSDNMLPDYIGMGLMFFAHLFKTWNDELHMVVPGELDAATAAAVELLRPEFRPTRGSTPEGGRA